MQIDSMYISLFNTFEQLGRDAIDQGLSNWQLLQGLCEIEDKLAEKEAVWTNPFAAHLMSKPCVILLTKMPNFHQTMTALQSDENFESDSSMDGRIKVPSLESYCRGFLFHLDTLKRYALALWDSMELYELFQQCNFQEINAICP